MKFELKNIESSLVEFKRARKEQEDVADSDSFTYFVDRTEALRVDLKLSLEDYFKTRVDIVSVYGNGYYSFDICIYRPEYNYEHLFVRYLKGEGAKYYSDIVKIAFLDDDLKSKYVYFEETDLLTKLFKFWLSKTELGKSFDADAKGKIHALYPDVKMPGMEIFVSDWNIIYDEDFAILEDKESECHAYKIDKHGIIEIR